MMKLSRFLSTRNQLFEQFACKKTGDARPAFELCHFSSQAGISGATARAGQNFTRTGTGSTSPQVFASYTVYKGKASLSMTPVLPTFSQSNSGNLVINRRGSVMLTFCPAIGERKYDFERKQLFALSATEVGSLISLGPKDSCEFLHDPAMLSSNAGQIRKNLSIKPQSDGNGYFISLIVVNNLQKTKENFYVPFTTGEFSVMKTACSYALPHILGWDRCTKVPTPSLEGVVPSKVLDRQASSSEWER